MGKLGNRHAWAVQAGWCRVGIGEVVCCFGERAVLACSDACWEVREGGGDLSKNMR